MKKIAVFLAVLLLLAAPVLAAEPTEALSDVLGADELTQSLPDEAAEVLDGRCPAHAGGYHHPRYRYG